MSTAGAGGVAQAADPGDRPSRQGAPFELLESKLRAPRSVDHGVARSALVAQLDAAQQTPIVIFCAGAGYGKTTTLAQWAHASAERPFAWVSVDRHDNDPVVLLTYVAAALSGVTDIDAGVFAALASPGASLEAKLVPRLGAALARVPEPLVLVLDDVHAITNPHCIDALVALAGHLTPGSQLVLSTRDPAALPLARWRTRGLTVELGHDDLRMDAAEAGALLNGAATGLSDEDVTELVERTEGWPAGLYLAALSAAATGARPETGVTVTGNDPLVLDFLRSELIASLPPDELAFLTLTSVLDRLSGPLCDAVLERTGSAAMLESLERSNRFVVALDRERTWYRCHHLLRELLAADLPRSSPELVSPMLAHASDWCMAQGHDVEAVSYAQAEGDVDRVAAAVARLAQPVFQSGRTATVDRWFVWLREQGGAERHPTVAVIAAIFYSIGGPAAEADRWTTLAETSRQSAGAARPSVEPWHAMLHAMRSTGGLSPMRENAELAVNNLPADSSWRPPATLLLGLSELLLGREEAADDRFVDAAGEASAFTAAGATPVAVPVAQAERALVAVARGQWVEANTLAEQALRTTQRSRSQEAPLHSLVYAVAARTAVHGGRTDEAGRLLIEAQRRLPGLTYTCPVPAVQTRLEMARAYLALSDHAGARTVLDEADAVLRRVPDLGPLGPEAAELRSTLGAQRNDLPGASALSAAELRILPLMTTHLSYREIGERRFLSRHTVKTHAMSIYRKLGVSSRTEAVDRAREVGLL